MTSTVPVQSSRDIKMPTPLLQVPGPLSSWGCSRLRELTKEQEDLGGTGQGGQAGIGTAIMIIYHNTSPFSF